MSEDGARADRLRQLLAMEIRRVTEDLERRRGLLVALWGRQRIRAPFVETTFSRWRSLGFQDLLALEAGELDGLERFYRELDELRLYLSFTEDMPRSLDLVLGSSLARLRRFADEALAALGVDPLAEVLPLEWAEDRPPPPGEEVELSLSGLWSEE